MESNKTKKLYKTILADPPWEFEQKSGLGAWKHYDLMSLEQIKKIPVADLADPEGSHFWLWCTNASLRYGYEVLEAYGYKPRSILTWVKPRLGLGALIRNSTEHLLIGTRGKVHVLFKSQPSWMFCPVQDHSHKPEEQYAIIERVSPGPYLELFARRSQPGWDKWGMEVVSDIHIPGYPVRSYREGVE